MKLAENIVAIVTGGASGLGAATASALAKHGVSVTIFDMNEELGEAQAASINGIFCRVDVTSDDDVAKGFAKSREVYGQERILVNCAGIAPAFKTASRDRKTGEVREPPVAKFAQVIEVNLIGTFRCIAHATAGMLDLDPLDDGDRGVIINTASVAAQDGQIGQAAYGASKAGVLGMTLPVARDLSGDGIRVNTILPGIFETPMLMGMPDEVRESLGASVPFPKRLGKPGEYADLAITMIQNAYFNAAGVRLDGAIRLAPR